jgi:hypothetical protein
LEYILILVLLTKRKAKMKTLRNILFVIILIVFQTSVYSNDGGEKFSKNKANIDEDITFTFIPGNSPMFAQLGKEVPITGDINQLKFFFNSLKETKNKVIRVAHFGDSQIQGDIISEYIREKLQAKFGGKGAGYLSIQANDIKMRMTTEHTFSSDWNFASIITRNSDNLPFGMSGSVAVPKPGSWVKYRSTNYLKSTSSFVKARLFYSNADESSSIQYTINGSKTTKVNLQKGESVQELIIDTKSVASLIEIKFLFGKQPYFYGVSLESGNGIYVDNFPMPGNTGASLLDIPINNLTDFNKLANYSLFILSYGNNVSSTNRGIYTVYENKMYNVIQQLRKAFPNTSILLFSVNDKTVKLGGRFVTNPEVPQLLETQKHIIDKSKVSFWNLWEAMGGQNSMNEWVNSAPPMALKDYSHFTQIGGERVAQLFIDALLDVQSKIQK